MNALLIALTLSQFPMDVFENAGAFTEVETRDGVTLSKRAVKDSPYFEYRVATTSSYSVAQLCDATYDWGTHEGDSPGVTLFKVVEDGDDVRVVYNQITRPIVAKRDYALTIVRLREGERCRIRFRTANDKAPAKPEGFVRMDKLWGEWLFEPAEKGSKLTYTLYSDPAGSVPAFLVHGGQSGATRESLMTALSKTKKAVEAKR
jgi:hypothetical protein